VQKQNPRLQFTIHSMQSAVGIHYSGDERIRITRSQFPFSSALLGDLGGDGQWMDLYSVGATRDSLLFLTSHAGRRVVSMGCLRRRTNWGLRATETEGTIVGLEMRLASSGGSSEGYGPDEK